MDTTSNLFPETMCASNRQLRLPPWQRLAIALPLLFIPLFGGEETRSVFFGSLSDAYLQVSVFVAITLFFFYGLETWLRIDTDQLLRKHKKYQVPIAAFMGMLPGCGGAIMVMTQFAMGRIGFGSVVAVLTATMGDAAFLLIAQDPRAAVIVLSLSTAVGIAFGYLVEWMHGYDFLQPEPQNDTEGIGAMQTYGFWKTPWLLLLVPGLILGLLVALQMQDPLTAWFASAGLPDLFLWMGVAGAVLSVALWIGNASAGTMRSNFFICRTAGDVGDKVTADTSFITVWVIWAYLVFELGVLWSGFDLGAVFATVRPVLPLLAVLIGFLPGCGPQVVVTTMYLQGLIPLSAQIGNGISNDGDALFPAMAVSPRASVIATLYTAIPALLVSYAWFFLFE